MSRNEYYTTYEAPFTDRIAFPLGGIGSGMFCIEGTGYFSHQSFHHHPEMTHDMNMFAALCVKTSDGNVAKVLEGPVPSRKRFNYEPMTGGMHATAGNGSRGNFGLPRFKSSTFTGNFPFCQIDLTDKRIPLECSLTGWSPFIPGNPNDSGLPVGSMEYTFTNNGTEEVEAVFSFHIKEPLTMGKPLTIRRAENSISFDQVPGDEDSFLEGHLTVSIPDTDNVHVDAALFRGGWFDATTILWRNIASGKVIDNQPHSGENQGPGGSLYVPFTVEPGQTVTVPISVAWYVPESTQTTVKKDDNCGEGCCCNSSKNKDNYKPWYAEAYASADAILSYFNDNRQRLRAASETFTAAWDRVTLPAETKEAILDNLAIIKSPTVMRQHDGRLWCWEGCCDCIGCCAGSCTHVWNYAQAIPHLFPSLERTLRDTEFMFSQDERGHQNFRTLLPIQKNDNHDFHAAADGQLGGIMKIHREWQVLGNNGWLRELWPQVKQSLEYCIETWDPEHQGVLVEPHHNTYDIEFWGADGMCTSFYLGALKAAQLMSTALGESNPLYEELFTKGKAYMESELFNGEFFIQKIQWEGLRAEDPTRGMAIGPGYSEEAIELLRKEGPKYQYGDGCLSDGVLGAWMAEVCGVGEILDPAKVRSHLLAVHKYNLKHDLSEHVNPQRPTYGFGDEGGLLLCSWPNGNALSLPFVYSDEVWTGIEYQVASHLMMLDCVDEGLEIVRVCRDRYDGQKRNPFNEYECGHFYARAMSSYGLLQGMTGITYNALTKTLVVKPTIKDDFVSFLATETGYGLAGVKNGEAFYEIVSGQINVEKVDFSIRNN